MNWTRIKQLAYKFIGGAAGSAIAGAAVAVSAGTPITGPILIAAAIGGVFHAFKNIAEAQGGTAAQVATVAEAVAPQAVSLLPEHVQAIAKQVIAQMPAPQVTVTVPAPVVTVGTTPDPTTWTNASP